MAIGKKSTRKLRNVEPLQKPSTLLLCNFAPFNQKLIFTK